MTATFRTSQIVSDVEVGKPHLILVGLPGSGKTAVGEALAERLNRSFLDFDREIERRESSSISEIFAVRGEPYFRQQEIALTLELRQCGNMVVAPGGGWVTNKGVVEISQVITVVECGGAGPVSEIALADRMAFLHTLRNGLIVREQAFRNKEDALRAARMAD